MNFDLDVEHQMLRDSARKFLAKEADSRKVRAAEESVEGYSPALWKKMAQLGWTGLMVPDAYEGGGLELLDMAIILEAVGHAAIPSPLFASSVLSALTLTEAGSEANKKKFLPLLASGEKIFTTAWYEEPALREPSDNWPSAVCDYGVYVVSGSRTFVPYAHIADYIVVAARIEATAREILLIIERGAPGVSIEVIATSTGESVCEVRFDQVRVSETHTLEEPGQLREILRTVVRKCAVAKCAEMTGGAEKVLSMTVDYAMERRQFGRPIGGFQAVQHHCADMKMYLETSALVTYRTCWLISNGKPWTKEAAMCKAWVSESCKKLTLLGHQVMGGLGFMEEADHQLYYRRTRLADAMFGNADFQREIVAKEMGL